MFKTHDAKDTEINDLRDAVKGLTKEVGELSSSIEILEQTINDLYTIIKDNIKEEEGYYDY